MTATLIILALSGAGFMGFMNFVSCLMMARNRHKGVDKTHPVLPFLSILLCFVAYYLSAGHVKWIFILLPLLDIGNWIGFAGLFNWLLSLVKRQ